MNFRLFFNVFVVWLGFAATHVDASRLDVVTSIRPIALIAKELAGEDVQVRALLPGNSDPHSYSLRVSDMEMLNDADLVIWLGPDLERFLAKPLSGKPSLQLTALPGLHWPSERTSEEDQHDGHHQGRDPHIWLNPENAAIVMRAVAKRLIELMPEQRAALLNRLERSLQHVDEYQEIAQRRLAPYRGDGFGVSHDGYGHFVDAFDLNQLDHVSDMPEQRLSAKKLQSLRVALKDAKCFISESGGGSEQRLAQLLGLPLVHADPLASDPAIATYGEFMLSMTDAFERCFKGNAK